MRGAAFRKCLLIFNNGKEIRSLMNKYISMKENSMEESVKICLYIGGDEIPLERITSVLEIEPTITRKKTEWNAANGLSCNEWIFELKKFKEINCPDIEEVF